MAREQTAVLKRASGLVVILGSWKEKGLWRPKLEC